jgi:hypothetical protein
MNDGGGMGGSLSSWLWAHLGTIPLAVHLDHQVMAIRIT